MLNNIISNTVLGLAKNNLTISADAQRIDQITLLIDKLEQTSPNNIDKLKLNRSQYGAELFYEMQKQSIAMSANP